MPLYIRIAVRYLMSLKTKALSFMTVISLLGIIVGVAALLITLAVMSGFLWGIKKKILETSPHIVIFKISGSFTEYNEFPEKYLKGIPEILEYQPFIYSQALASKDSTVISVTVRGVPPEKDKRILGIDKKIIAGNYDSIKDDKYVIVGKDVALALNVWIGDSITLTSPFGRKTPLGYIPKVKKVYVGGVIDFGMYEYDSTYIGMNLESAQRFFDMKDSVTGIQLKIDDPYKAAVIKSILEEKIHFPYIIRSWMDLNKSLFQALELEKLAMFLVLALIVLVASFNISSLLITKAREKRKDIGILKTIGADSRFIMKIFLWQGLIIGITGTIIGLTIGLTVIYFGDTYHLIKLNPEVYMMEYLPLKIGFIDILAVSVASMVICFISSVIPAYMASKEIPSEVLRYE
ncbi:FtsX-like permease family protein [Persephonella sp.]